MLIKYLATLSIFEEAGQVEVRRALAKALAVMGGVVRTRQLTAAKVHLVIEALMAGFVVS